ncbi:mitogen-activated kinase kinase kinase kinase 2-like protein [Labeo rohita]|uniref:non-specific serine/threonine protein kinase n=1 Tax=Labeo rohita TaxID=84645 RepID=A0A498LHD7_LABRO|nr:mitogen-activated kinase kinase kinase kinase 2-like protein [Labeo rohita]
MNTIGVSFLDPLDDYEIIQRIGSGTYGDVFKARNIRSSEMAAIKIVKLDPGDDITSIQQEITMMKECKHKNIVAYYGTYHRMAPEVAAVEKKGGYNHLCDIWAVGITAIELAELQPPMFDLHPMRALMLMSKSSFQPPKLKEKSKWSAGFHSFVKMCLIKSPRKRPTAETLLQHPFVTQLLTRKLMIELLDMASNPDLHHPPSPEENEDASDTAPDTIQSKGKHMPVERSLSEEQFDQVKFTPPRRKETEPYPDLGSCDDWSISGDEPESPGLLESVEEELQQRSLTVKRLSYFEWSKRKSGLFSPPPVSATTSLPPLSSLDSDLEDKNLTLRPSATLCPENVLSPKSVLLRCSGSQDVRHWCSDPCVPDDTQDRQRTLTRTLSRDTALSPEWSTMRKKTEDSMGACFSKVFNGCPLKIHCAETWVLPKTRDQYLILGAEEGVYILNLNELHEDTLEKLLPQRCTWLYVMNNVLMSISGKSPHLYSHRLIALFEQRGHLQRKQGHLSLGTNRFAERIIHRKFAVSVKIADTKGCRKCSVARNPYTDSTFLCAAVPSGLVLLLWYEPLQKFMHLKHIPVPLPDPLPIFELLVLMTDELPQLCVGVQESLQQQNERQLKFDIIHLNGMPNPQPDSETIKAVQVTQLDRDTVLIALEKTVKIVNMQGVPSKELASELEFDFPIETLVCLEESVLAFWKHGLKGLSLHNCELKFDLITVVELSHYKQGDDVTIKCFLTKKNFGNTMVWYKQSTGLIPRPIGLSYNYWNNIQFEDEFNNGRISISATEDSFHLNITAMTKEDTGKYYCGIVFLNKIEFISGAHLMLKGSKNAASPSYEIGDSDVNYAADGNRSDTSSQNVCSAYIYSYILHIIDNKSALIFTKITSRDAAYYHCGVLLYEKLYFGGGTYLTVNGTYFCGAAFANVISFSTGTVLLVKGADLKPAVIQQPVLDVLKPGNNVTLQCSVEVEMCEKGVQLVYWYRRSSDTIHPGMVYTQGDMNSECGKNSVASSPTQSCQYNLPKMNVGLSDAGLYYCAVVTCDEVLFGNDEFNSKMMYYFIIIGLAVLCTVSLTINILLYIPLRRKDRTPQQIQAANDDAKRVQYRNTDDVNYAALNLSTKIGSESKRIHILQQPQPGITSSDGNVTLQCTIENDQESCGGEQNVYWFRHSSHPGIIYTQGSCKNSSVSVSPTKSCVYSLSLRNIKPSDAGTYYCALVTCTEILFGQGINLAIDDQYKDQHIYILIGLAALLTISFISNILLCVKMQKERKSQQIRTTNEDDNDEESANKNREMTYATVQISTKQSRVKKERHPEDTLYSGLVYQQQS